MACVKVTREPAASGRRARSAAAPAVGYLVDELCQNFFIVTVMRFHLNALKFRALGSSANPQPGALADLRPRVSAGSWNGRCRGATIEIILNRDFAGAAETRP